MRYLRSMVQAFKKRRRPRRVSAKTRAELDAVSMAHTGQSFAAFVAFARRAQREHGYVPSVVAAGPRPEQRADAEAFARALERRGLKVWRGWVFG